MIIVGLTVGLIIGSTAAAQSRRVLADLGRLDPPAYSPPLVRTGEGAPVFDEAIAAYRARKFERTADLLRRFAAVEPDDPAGNFFLAAALMMIDDVGEAEDRLRVVLAAGETPFDAAARFISAKARIRVGDLDSAERELARVEQTSSAYARQAGDLLIKVRAVKKRK